MNSQQHPGMINEEIDSMSIDPQVAATQQAELADSRPAVDGVGPSVQPKPYSSNTERLDGSSGSSGSSDGSSGWKPGGTVISSTTYNVSDSGIHEVNSYSRNTTEQWEARVNQADEQRLRGRSIYNSPVTQGKSVMPNVDGGAKATPEQLELIRQRDKLISINQRLKSLQVDRQRTSLKLKGIDEAIRNLQTEVEGQED